MRHNATRQKPGRKSSIVTHPQRAEIELARATGSSLRKIAEGFGVSRSALDRHWHGLSPEYRTELAGMADELQRYEKRIRAHFAARKARALANRACQPVRSVKVRRTGYAHAL